MVCQNTRNSHLAVDSHACEKRGLVLAVGELLWDLLPQGKVLGGAPANFCAQMQSRGFSPMLVSAVGDDQLGREALSILKARGLDTGGVQIISGIASGTSQVTLTVNGDPSFHITSGAAYDQLHLDCLLVEAAAASTFFYFGTLVQRSMIARNTLYSLLDAAAAAIKLLDVNLRPDCFDQQTLRESLRRADLVKLNQHEVEIMSGILGCCGAGIRRFCELLFVQYQVQLVVVTLGEKGAFGMNQQGEEAYVPGLQVPVIDTVGAGDAFTAGFAQCYIRGNPLLQCLEYGNLLGAMTAARRGGMPVISSQEIELFTALPAKRKVISAL